MVPSRCYPPFDAVDIPMKPTVTIAFDSIVHIGMGTIEFHSVMDHPDHMSIVIYDLNLVGLQKYQVIFNAGIVLSQSGSKCGTRNDYFFTVESGDIVIEN